MDSVILSTAYLGPVSYFIALANAREVFIEQYDSYHKQTYRNRCRIVAANGPLDLVVPVVKNSGVKTQVKDVRIDYSTRWQGIHWRSFFSAYNSSPFFEYYAPIFEPFYAKKWEFLLDLNLELTNQIIDLLQLDKNLELTDKYEKQYSGVSDLRDMISPKFRTAFDGEEFVFPEYTQTFSEKFGFIADLSIVDLLFNCGPESELLLQLRP